MMGRRRRCVAILNVILLISAASAAGSDEASVARQAREILRACSVPGGLIVHVGCGDGKLTAALHQGDADLVHGLGSDATDVEKAREHIRTLGLYGPVSVEQLRGSRLPYVNNLVNLVVSEDPGTIGMEEVMRVLCPDGVAYVKQRQRWQKVVKPRPTTIDDWTHYLHDASNNAVSHDKVVGPPRRMQWIGGPKYGRHHDRMSSVSAAVSANGRVFYIIDEASPASILIPPQWTLVARDAFNGIILWKRRMGAWHTHLWPLKSGPAQLPRRLVAVGDRVYATLGLNAPLTVLDAVTGATVRTLGDTQATEEILYSNGTLFLLVNGRMEEPQYADPEQFKHGYNAAYWDQRERHIVAVDATTGQSRWRHRATVLPNTLAADGDGVYFHDGAGVVCLDRSAGDVVWRSGPVDRAQVIKAFYAPTLVLYDGVVLFSGGETAGGQTGSWYTSGKDTMTALSARTGEVLWTAYHPPSGYRSAEDLLVANGRVWTGETTSGRAIGVFTGRDPRTGRITSEFQPDLQTYWFHHRCYRGKATDNYLLMSRTGIEFLDLHNETWVPHHWVRGACLYGVMPANGLVYSPPHPCACYLESKMYGFNALASAADENLRELRKKARLEKGPAYGLPIETRRDDDNWPTYRHDNARTGCAATSVTAKLNEKWRTAVGDDLTSPTAAEGKVFLADKDTHTVHALDARSGERLWRFTAGGRVDSPPTIHEGRVLFGSADGHVYCLRATDGALIWRFCAAPADRRLVAFGQIESVWPVHGSVLVQDGTVYCVAGRLMFLDGGLRLWRLDPKTGAVLSQTTLDDRDPATGKGLQDYVSWLNMPTAMPDILSSDGRLVYMRSQPFRLDGTRLPLEKMPAGKDADRGAPPATQDPQHAHLFSPTGFLDDAYWHRSYWLYGSRFVSGWCGYFLAGKTAPAGRILVFDDSTVYGFGRKPKYYRWTTPIEHQLFAAEKFCSTGADETGGDPSRVSVAKSASLNPAGKPLTIATWIKAERSSGVILARGGGNHGYVLYLSGGRPHFAVRREGKLTSVRGAESVVGRWVHLAGVLTADELQLFVDGSRAASTDGGGLLTADPAEAMEIGADEGSVVGDYAGPLAFKGSIDEVRLYHRALRAAEVMRHASQDPGALGKTDLVLWYSFDRGDASDASGHGHDGQVGALTATRGRFGQAMRFSGRVGEAGDFVVEHHWTQDVPLLVRAMVLAGNTLFVAGPPDLVDEEQAFREIDDMQVQRTLAEQGAAFEGRRGALLMTVSTAGDPLAQYELDSLPVFDGMIAAEGKLFLATAEGDLICLGSDEPGRPSL